MVLHEAHRRLLQEEVDITSAGVQAKYLAEDKKGKTLRDLITSHNTSTNTVLRKGTMKNYYSTIRRSKEFLNEDKRTLNLIQKNY